MDAGISLPLSACEKTTAIKAAAWETIKKEYVGASLF
jgi:hypothetical protein